MLVAPHDDPRSSFGPLFPLPEASGPSFARPAVASSRRPR